MPWLLFTTPVSFWHSVGAENTLFQSVKLPTGIRKRAKLECDVFESTRQIILRPAGDLYHIAHTLIKFWALGKALFPAGVSPGLFGALLGGRELAGGLPSALT